MTSIDAGQVSARVIWISSEPELEVPKESWEQYLERLPGIDPLRCPKC